MGTYIATKTRIEQIFVFDLMAQVVVTHSSHGHKYSHQTRIEQIFGLDLMTQVVVTHSSHGHIYSHQTRIEQIFTEKKS
jgi:hypothetical protein